MLDKIVTLETGKSYVMLDKKVLDNTTYYFALRLDNNEKPTNNYLFFEEVSNEYLMPVTDENMKGLLLTAFTIKYVDKVYDL